MNDWSIEVEFPLADEPPPLWSENYAFTCFDAQRNLAMMTLLGRWWGNPQIWREVTLLSLDGDRVVCVRNYGSAATATVPSASMFRVEIIEPAQHLRLSYEGPASAT